MGPLIILLPLLFLLAACQPEPTGPKKETWYDRVLKRQQELIQLCQDRGGIPILNWDGNQLERCDFPVVVVRPEVVEK